MKFFLFFNLFFLGMLPAPAQQYELHYFSFQSQLEDLKMAYVYEKPDSYNGKTVVLLHGKNFSNKYWWKTIDSLLHKGFAILAPDQIGFGNSSMPAKYQYTFHQLAFNTKKLIDTLGIARPIIIGHSLGGMLAIRYALMYPNECSRLILEDPIGLEDWKLSIPYSSIDESYKSELSKDSSSLKKYMLENYFHGEWKQNYNALLADCSVNLGRQDYAWSMALTTDMMFTQPVLYEFQNIKVPVVLIIGDKDRTAPGKEKLTKEKAAKLGNYPALGKNAAAKIPDCKLIMLKGVGHIPHEEVLGQFISILNTAINEK